MKELVKRCPEQVKGEECKAQNGEFKSEDGKFKAEDASSLVPNETEEDVMGFIVVIYYCNLYNICCWG